jgi:hypothetical protein
MTTNETCDLCDRLIDDVTRMMAGQQRVKERYDELIRELLFAIDELVDEEGNANIERLDAALSAIKSWLGWTDGRDETLIEWAQRK